MNYKIRKFTGVIALVVVVFGSFSLGAFYERVRSQKLSLVNAPSGVDLSLFWEVWNKLEKNYFEPLDRQKMVYGAVSGLVNSLGDPYTVFFDPEQSKIFEEDISGKFGGVGMEIGIRDKQPTVVAPLKGTPADRAGLRPGDKILKVNNALVSNMSIEEIVKLIRGPSGTKVKLTISRDGWDNTKEFTITRAMIEIPSVKWELKDTPKTAGPIAYIRLYQFSGKSSSDFSKIALKVLDSPAKKIILDLRNNPGGLLTETQNIAGWFLKKGDVMAIEESGKGRERKEWKTNGNSMFLNYPMVVLMNKGSASGAEILAAALRDNRGIQLIGETSFGKGLVQKPVPLSGGSTLKVTVARWLTPKGKLIQGKGLEPNVKIEMTDEDYQAGRDPQLDKAIEILKDL